VRELEVVGVRVELPNNQPIVLLRESGGDLYLPIWIGAAEATAIAYAQQGVVPPRPLTHDLFKDVLEALGHQLEEVRIVAVRDGVFYASLVFDGGVEVSSRSSDAIALALRTDAKIFAADDVIEESGVEFEGDEEEASRRLTGQDSLADLDPDEFRRFLDTVSPDEFAAEPEDES
jgi:bifunctional DNase/RNase